MQILTEIYRDPSLKVQGKIDHRLAVRAVVIRDRDLLMIYSSVNGDYKFPGGGVEANEKPEIALQREVAEECGMKLVRILQEIGSIVEYAHPMKKEFDVFKMTSSYYLCDVDATTSKLKLDDYEEELGFQPMWVNIDTSIQTNKSVLAIQTKWPPVWTAREVFMLEHLKAHYLNP